MRILLSASGSTRHPGLATALSDAGHDVDVSDFHKKACDEARVAIVCGIEELRRAADASCDLLAILDEPELAAVDDCPRRPRDLLVTPIRHAELEVRLASMAAELPPKERTRQSLLASAVAHAHDVIELMDPDGVLEYVNPAYATTFGADPQEVVGQLAPHLAGITEDSTSTLTKSAIAMSRGMAWSGILVARTEPGERTHFEASITPMRDTRGRITHYVAVKRDISERLASNAALAEANDALQRARDAAITANRAKSEFLANMSHELRTPLNAIIGYSEILIEDLKGDEQAAKDIQRVISAARHLLELINEVLDLAKIEAQKVDIVPKQVFLAELTRDLVDEMTPLAERNDNRIELRLDNSPEHMVTDPLRLRQVLQNLISNACKFTEKGVITLVIEATTQHGEPWVIMRVSDTGIGIAEADQKHLFDPFVQADPSTERHYGGTGLGLAITLELCTLLGGGVTLESELGVGSTFTVRLPVTFSRE